MGLDSSLNRFTRVAIALHWLVAALVLGQVILGWWLSDIPRGTPARGTLVNIHKSIGLTVWGLIVIRLGWRLGHPPPDRKSTRLNSSHQIISYAVFCLKKKKKSYNK